MEKGQLPSAKGLGRNSKHEDKNQKKMEKWDKVGSQNLFIMCFSELSDFL